MGQGRLTQSRPARSQPPCLVPSRLIPTINKHTVLVHVNRLHSGGELSLRGALLHLGIDSVPSTYISGLTPLARPEQIPPESTERNTILKTRSILDVMRGYMSLFAPGRQLAKSALPADRWMKRTGESRLQPRAASRSYIRSVQGRRRSEAPSQAATDGKRPHVGLVTRLAPSTTGTS